MRFEANFGNSNQKVRRADSGKFRLAVMGDFSGRANKGELETGEALARRKPLNVHFDNLDDVIARLNIALDLPVGATGSNPVKIESMDDFHPDELYQKLGIFAEIARLRKRLQDTASFASAAKEVQEWLGDETLLKPIEQKTQARGATIPTKDSIDDFINLVGESTVNRETASAAIENLLKNAVAPYIEPSADPRQDAMVAAVDGALSGMMRSILHHPDLLKRIAHIVADSNTPFIASVGLDCLEQDSPVQEWTALHSLPEASYLALTVPKFMLRIPYGEKGEPIDPFDFEELIAYEDTRKFLWGHSSILAGLSLGMSYMEQGLSGMKIQANMTLREMPYHFYTDADGDQVALPCTEQLFTETQIGQIIRQNLIPMVSIKGQPEVQTGSWGSLSGKNLSGPWTINQLNPC